MNIKKFEARTMKEALDMVKSQLGPDAVILAAKEITKSFGLGGEKSIEITAAYSENILKQREYVQSRMPENDKNRFNQMPARLQKETIQKSMTQRALSQKVIEEKLARTQYAYAPQKSTGYNSISTKRYIDIDNDSDLLTASPSAAQAKSVTQKAVQTWNSMDVQSLKSEIDQLKQLVGQFKQIPQKFVQSHPGADYGVDFDFHSTYTKLVNKGLLPEVAADILVQAQAQIEPQKLKQPQYLDTWVGKYILNSVPVVAGGFEQFHFFMGTSGSGKTTSMVKLASQLVLKHKKRVALISTDTIKVGADQQMKIFSEILNLPFISIRTPSDWNKIIPHLSQVDHVLVDFASMSLRSQNEIEYLKKMLPPIQNSIRTHLVLSAKTNDKDLFETIKKYRVMNVTDLIVTSLDEATQYGQIYNLVRKQSIPLFGFGIGAKVPEDFERATAERVLDLILELTQSTQSTSRQEIAL
jgi:flagellar biosynthesis protein FlhF